MRIRAMKKQSQNKANLLNAQMNISSVLTKDYNNEQRTMNNELLFKTNPNKPNPPARYAIRNTRYEIQTQPPSAPVFTPKINIAPEKQPQKTRL